MLSRALVVLLLVLNLGVAAWILLRPDAPVAAAPAASPGVPALRLVGGRVTAPAAPSMAAADVVPASSTPMSDGSGEDAAPAQPTAAPDTAETTADARRATSATEPVPVAAAPATPPPAPRCFTAGPYPAAAATAARASLLAAGATAAATRTGASAPRGWRVVIAPQANRDAAIALAERLRADGFDDLLVINDGSDANGIALGRYRGETAARQREASLRARSYPAVAQAIGDVDTTSWLDVTAAAGPGIAALRAAAGAPLQPVPCAAT